MKELDPLFFSGEKTLPETNLKVADFDPEVWIKEKWKHVLIMEEPAEEQPLLYINHVPIATPGNYTLIIGKKKCRKTLFAVWLISEYKGDIENDVLIFDTEQGKRHVWKIQDKIKQLTGKEVPVFFLRGQSFKDKIAIIENSIAYWPEIPKLILIDGIRDLMSNINNPDESTYLIEWLEKITRRYNTHIINVLHMNKNDDNARGHIGTELSNKAQTTIELEKDPKTGITIVKCGDSRDMPFEGFAFSHNADELPEIVNMPIAGEVMPDDEKKSRLRFVFEDGVIKRGHVIAGIKNHFSVGESKAGILLAGFMRCGWIIKDGKDNSANAVYKLLV